MKSIAGYNVIKLLAKGGMAAIYLAEQESLERQVILKFLNPKLDENIRKRFIDEGRIIASLKHPNIITIFDVVTSGKYNFLAMEFLPDGDLESRLTSKLDTFCTLNIISQISDALHLVHKQGIIHGDIKPANILFRSKDCPLITDFGISHRIEPKKEVDLCPDELYASPSYASPELIQGKPFDYRTDIYSLGVMMYEMLMGKKPFTGETDLETIANSIQKPIPKLSDELHELQPLLNSLLAKAPDERLSDAKLVTRFIKQYLKQHPNLNKSTSETKLIDTDVVVEYVNQKKMKQYKSYFLYSFISITLLISLYLLFINTTVTDDKTAISKIKIISNEKKLNELKLSTTSKAETTDLVSNETLHDLKLREQALIEKKNEFEREILLKQQQQEAAIKKKNIEIAQAKKALERQKQLSRQKKQLSQRSSIKNFLSKGKSSLKKYNLTTPLNDNAIYYFQKVLELDKNNKEAKKGVKDVVYRYELLARSELDKFNYQKAQSYISTGLSVDSENKRLLQLQEEANLHSEPGRVVNKVKNFFKNL